MEESIILDAEKPHRVQKKSEIIKKLVRVNRLSK